MRLRTLLAATAAGALTTGLVGAVGVPAHSVIAPPTADAGTLVTWGDAASPNGADAIPVPGDLTGPVRSVAANAYATGVVTVDGRVRVWGKFDKPEVAFAPTDITDATAIALTNDNGAVLHADGRITAWGDSTPLSEVPDGLRAQSIALQVGTGWAVQPDGTLATWGAAAPFPAPAGLTGLVDVSAATTHALTRHADGTVATWGFPVPALLAIPDFGGKSVVRVATGPLYSGVILDDGTVSIWGPGAPAGQPTFDGQSPAGTVVDLALGSGNAVAVTADGAVHHWGANALLAVPESLAGQPVSAVAIGTTHAAAVVTTFRELTKPTITGTPRVGSTLTATPATFSADPDSVTGQWLANGTQIAGATGTTLAVTKEMVGKRISFASTAAKAGHEPITSTSAETASVSAPPTVRVASRTRVQKVIVSSRAAKVTVIGKVTTSGSPAGKAVMVIKKGKTTIAKGTVRVAGSGDVKAVVKRFRTIAQRKVRSWTGKYKVTLRYLGNAGVLPSTGAKTFTVRR